MAIGTLAEARAAVRGELQFLDGGASRMVYRSQDGAVVYKVEKLNYNGWAGTNIGEHKLAVALREVLDDPKVYIPETTTFRVKRTYLEEPKNQYGERLVGPARQVAKFTTVLAMEYIEGGDGQSFGPDTEYLEKQVGLRDCHGANYRVRRGPDGNRQLCPIDLAYDCDKVLAKVTTRRESQ